MSRFKYICEECNEATVFSVRERTREAGMRCRFCGCRYLTPSKRSRANDRLSTHGAIKAKYDSIADQKREGEGL